MKTRGTVWLLGASSGLGLATAHAFAEAGWLVVAGARSFAAPSGAEETGKMAKQGTEKQNIHQLPLDVTDEACCEAFARQALAISDRVDVLCYAAGLLVLGSCEETDAGEYERVMQTNFIGMTRMVAKVLPVMRAQKSGKLLLFSSLNGVMGIPFQSAYTASKHAIEGYAECLALEVKPFHISVCVVEPGDHQGGSQAYRLHAGMAKGSSAYAQEYASACTTIHRDESAGLPAERLGRKVAQLADAKKMRFRLRVASIDQRAACLLHAMLPQRLFSSLMRSYYVKKGSET